MDPLDDIARLVAGGKRFLVGAHARPDGDALGSMLATMHALKSLGKDVVAYNRDRAPERLRGLPGATDVVTKPPNTRFDGTFVHDCGDVRLLGENFPPATVTGPVVVLDHHASTRPYGDLVYRDPTASAVGVLVGRLIRRLDIKLNADMAQCLWCSLASDTGWFRYSATNVETMQLATDCVAAGAEPWRFARMSEEEAPVARLRLLREVLGTLEILDIGPNRRAAFLAVEERHLSAARAQPEMAEGFVNYARGLEGVEVGVLLQVTRQGIRVSLRGKGGLDVGVVAAAFDGGGHKNAAGCLLPAPLEAARDVLVAALSAAPVA